MATTESGSLFSDRLCRICAFEADDNEPLFQSSDGVLSESGIMFASCLSLELDFSDGYPTMICFRCNTQLRMFSEFRRGALYMHTKFSEKLEKHRHQQNPPLIMKQEIDPKVEPLQFVEDEESLLDILVGDEKVPDNSTDHVESVIYSDELAEQQSNEIVHGTEEPENTMYKCEESTVDSVTEYATIVSVIEEEGEEEMDVTYLEDGFAEEVEDEEEYIDSGSQPDEALTNNPKRPRFDQYPPTNLSIVPNDSMVCELCHKSIKLSVKNHVCTSDEKFECEICSREFVTKQRRDMHQARHTSERPISCDECDKSFKNKYDLKVHLRSHGEVRSFVCDICGRAFRASSHLSNHIQSHALENQYECEHCGQRYKTSITLLRHITSMHTRKDEYKCEICSKTFGLKFRYQRHMKIHEKKSRESAAIYED